MNIVCFVYFFILFDVYYLGLCVVFVVFIGGFIIDWLMEVFKFILVDFVCSFYFGIFYKSVIMLCVGFVEGGVDVC